MFGFMKKCHPGFRVVETNGGKFKVQKKRMRVLGGRICPMWETEFTEDSMGAAEERVYQAKNLEYSRETKEIHYR